MSARIFNLMAYGDYDIPYSFASFIIPEDMSKEYIKRIQEGVSALFRYDEDEDAAINYCKNHGLIRAKRYESTIGGGL